MTVTKDDERMGARERLVTSAIGLLHQQAYGDVGVQALCDMAGVRKGSFYYFFPSKEDLILAAVNEAWATFRSEVMDPILAVEPDDEARRVAIRRACLEHSCSERAVVSGQGCVFGRLAASITDGEPVLRARLGEIFMEWSGLLGGGPEGWAALADIQGRLILGFAVAREVIRA